MLLARVTRCCQRWRFSHPNRRSEVTTIISRVLSLPSASLISKANAIAKLGAAIQCLSKCLKHCTPVLPLFKFMLPSLKSLLNCSYLSSELPNHQAHDDWTLTVITVRSASGFSRPRRRGPTSLPLESCSFSESTDARLLACRLICRLMRPVSFLMLRKTCHHKLA